MYTRPSQIYYTASGLESYINGSDVYNSKLIYLLEDKTLTRYDYVIKTEFRTDLIAEDFYGDVGYEGFVILQISAPLSSLKRGVTIKLIAKSDLQKILSEKF